ncbi:hypothetical protein JTE90_010692 [Oedothorax gibbosus]|uniref:Uncharacterized protein n=1 Tax=Oedothorax gibbosus TaxID=931172 RepID=A0AAV6USJ5_9ARAC|nr:hypothetical protein JTE90_010692 [Oedothorax gibbosus]
MDLMLKFLIFGIIGSCYASYASLYVNQIKREWFTNEPCVFDEFRCNNSRCTKLHYVCDRDSDCGDHSDEYLCHLRRPLTEKFGFHMIRHTRERAAKWLIDNVDKISVFNDWNYALARSAIALYLTNETYFAPGNATGKKIAGKLELQMLEKLTQRTIEDIPTTELALYVNAFLVSCLNPRNFHGHDLVVELRVRTNTPGEYTNPFELLALCNAGEAMTAEDVVKLQDVFENPKTQPWIDMQAYAMMALSCASKQLPYSVNMSEQATKFNRKIPEQNANHTVDNIKTTALIMQGFLATGKFPSPPPSSRYTTATKYFFNANGALRQLISDLKHNNDSMDKVHLMYYLLPSLSYKTLGNITFIHCHHHQVAVNAVPLIPMKTVKYSLWFGIDKYIEKTMTLRVNSTAKFKNVMDMASKIDSSYRYNATFNSTKPHVYSISGTEDDPENGRFWFFYRLTNSLATEVINKSKNPLEYNPVDKEHLLFWFRRGPWTIEE